jgi:hypothetical protein
MSIRLCVYAVAALLSSFVHAEEKSFPLQAPCEVVRKELSALRQWTTSRNETCDLPPMQSLPNNTCKVEMKHCLPKEVLQYDGTGPATDGPNCWNLALVMSGAVPALRYSTPEEMAFFMNSALCRKLGPEEKHEPGDVGAIRINGEELHGFMWISDDIVFSKNGSSLRSTYEVQSKDGMLKIYNDDQTADCKAKKLEKCDIRVETMRCQSMASYLKDPHSNLPVGIQKVISQMELSERCVSGYHFKPSLYNIHSRQNIVQSVEVLTAMVQDPSFKKQVADLPDDQRAFIDGSMKVRLQSMYEQIQMQNFNSISHCDLCAGVARSLRKAVQNSK